MTTPFVYHARAQSTFEPPLIANENAFLGDLASRSVRFSLPNDNHGLRLFRIAYKSTNK